jgi:hypothetical protein
VKGPQDSDQEIDDEPGDAKNQSSDNDPLQWV